MSDPLVEIPAKARAGYVLAHGAGAGMKHPFLSAVAKGLAERGIATLRYEFPYMEAGSKRPDSPAIAQAAVRTAVAEAARRMPGLIFLGFPLHAPGKPSIERAAHLDDVKVPMLFLQGSRDTLAQLDLLRPVTARLGERATLRVFDEAHHSFLVPARSGRKGSDVMTELLDELAVWVGSRL